MKSNKSDSDSSSSSSESSDDECEKVVNMKHLRSSALAQLTNVNVVKETTLSVSSYHPTASKCEETDKVSRQRSSTATEASVDELQQFQADTSISSSSLLSVREHEKVEERDEDRHSPMCDTQECCTSKKSRAQSSACENNGSLIETFGERIDVCMGGKCKKFGAAELLEELQKKIGMEGVVVGCKCMGKCKNAPNVRVLNKRSMNSAEGMGTSISAPSNPLYLGVGLDDIDIIVSNFLGEGRTKNIGSMAAA
ncbi:Diacylglycerol O-acyltransferase 3, cytosolic [Thalictrum thalictroides]|uniref:Diacylglycerol O-acyltransferase 3, cytosolic n=1 Tax=Thalictrum thalictroides TaxID=46969 RepID=A0A7J6V9P3_THATH|nr:Diacylglycerol O-acyltransferase 3, cytosolic [Thalictrum thalictroides]